MKQLKLAWMIAALAALGAGCAHVVEMRVPREFKGKKQVEDPPLSRLDIPACPDQAA